MDYFSNNGDYIVVLIKIGLITIGILLQFQYVDLCIEKFIFLDFRIWRCFDFFQNISMRIEFFHKKWHILI